MRNNAFRIIFITTVSIILSSVLPKYTYSNLISVFYTVAGIVFSIGVGVVSGFDLSRIKNKSYLEKIRLNIISTRNSFILFFIYATFTLLLSQYLKEFDLSYQIKGVVVKFDFETFALCSILFSIIFFIVNFIEIQNLRDQITDRLLEESENKFSR